MPPRNFAHNDVKTIDGKRIATPEYRSWQMMKNRCLNPRTGDYRYYGGRGIRICKRWLKFENFLADMGRKLSPALTLDRKNVNKNYCKSNCRWATRATQSQNRTNTRFDKAKVAEIRRRYFSEEIMQSELAVLYHTTQAAISQIVRGAAWANASGPTKRNSNGRNRRCKGDDNTNTKLSDAGVVRLRRLHSTGNYRQKELARQFGISQAQVSKIILGQRQCAQ